MSKTKSGLVPLSKATAEKLIRRYVGPRLTVEGGTAASGAAIFIANTGCLEVRCENDWFERNGRLKVTISDPLGGSVMKMYVDPETLERDYEAENAERLEQAQQARREWVLSQGPAYCHQMVDKLWEGG